MCGKSETPEIQPTQQEITQAKQAVAKYNERHEDGYVGLELDAIADARIDHTEPLRGVASAELAKQESGSYQMANPFRKGLDFDSIGTAVGTSKSNINVESRHSAQNIRDEKMLGVVRTGQDMSNNTAGSLMSRARDGLSTATADAKAKVSHLDDRWKALNKVLGTASSIYANEAAKHNPDDVEVRDAVPMAQSSVEFDPLDYNNIYGYSGRRV